MFFRAQIFPARVAVLFAASLCLPANSPAAPLSAAPAQAVDVADSGPGETAILSDIHAVQPASPDAAATNSSAASPQPGAAPTATESNTPAADGLTSPLGINSNPSDPLPNAGSAIPPAPSSSATQNVTINLINLMVKRNLITADDAAALIKQAQDEAVAAQAQAVTVAQVASAAQPAAPAVPAEPAAAENESDSVSITYIPDTVRQQMKDEIKQDVLNQAREERWAAPRTFPTWASRFTFFGDMRFRYEDLRFPDGNANDGHFFNFNSINTGSPLNNVAGTPTPFYNVDQDRERLRLRARFGFDVQLDEGFTSGMRIATGSDDSPATENQTFGASNNGQGGEFAKYAVWLDRAFLKYQFGTDPDRTFSATLGRFENPFMHTSMIFTNDLGFDGLMVQGKYKVEDGLTPFGTAGLFPVYNTDLNFASTNAAKFGSEDKWLYAGQIGTDWKINQDFNLKGAISFYDYENVEGKLSNPVVTLTSSDQGNTDDTRPSFAQNGNTYFPIRDVQFVNVSTDPTKFVPSPNYQYYGLATAFHEVALTAQLDVSHFDPCHIQLTGEYVKNIAFDNNSIDAVAINNLGSSGHFDGGDSGYLAHLVIGAPLLEKRWDWNVDLTYRYVESDSTLDAFADSDFGGPLVGTNLKGYTIGGGVALSQFVWLNVRWMSADAIAGPTYHNDLVQFDVNSHF